MAIASAANMPVDAPLSSDQLMPLQTGSMDIFCERVHHHDQCGKFLSELASSGQWTLPDCQE